MGVTALSLSVHSRVVEHIDGFPPPRRTATPIGVIVTIVRVSDSEAAAAAAATTTIIIITTIYYNTTIQSTDYYYYCIHCETGKG